MKAILAVLPLALVASCAPKPLSETELARVKTFVSNLNTSSETMHAIAHEAENGSEPASFAARAKGETPRQRGVRVFRRMRRSCVVTPIKSSDAPVSTITGGNCPVSVTGDVTSAKSDRTLLINSHLVYEVISSEIKEDLDVDRFTSDLALRVEQDQSEIRLNSSVRSKTESDVKIDSGVTLRKDTASTTGYSQLGTIKMTFKDFPAEIQLSTYGGVQKATLNGKELTAEELQAVTPAISMGK